MNSQKAIGSNINRENIPPINCFSRSPSEEHITTIVDSTIHNSESKEPQLELSDQQKKNFRYSVVGLKLLALMFVLMVFMYFGKINKIDRPTDFCIVDNVHQFLDPVNKKMHQSKIFKNSLQIGSSLCMDVSFLLLLSLWIAKSKSGYPLIGLVMFYGIRALVQKMFLFRFPDGDIWDSPGIPSITVPYGLQCDFYFSGHCGMLVLMTREMTALGFKSLRWIMILSLPLVAFVLVASRTHYSIDIPVGMMFGYYVFHCVKGREKLIGAIGRFVFCNKRIIEKTQFLDK